MNVERYAYGECMARMENTRSVDFDYTDAWVLPVMLVFFTLLIPVANSYRVAAKLRAAAGADADAAWRSALIGWALMAVHVGVAVVVAAASTGRNRAPQHWRRYEPRVVLWVWPAALAAYLAARDAVPWPRIARRFRTADRLFASDLCTFSAAFWDLAVPSIGSWAMPMLGFWVAVGYSDFNTDFGHILPALGFCGYAGLMLYNSTESRRRRGTLLRVEGWMWLVWGLVFIVPTSVLSTGWYGWRTGDDHLYQSVLCSWSGAASVVLTRTYRARYGDGVLRHTADASSTLSLPIATLLLVMGLWLLSHVQRCDTMTMLHRVAGVNFVLAAAMRLANHVLEASFFLALGAGVFAFTNTTQTYWFDLYFNPMSYALVSVFATGLWWSYNCAVFRFLLVEEEDPDADPLGVVR